MSKSTVSTFGPIVSNGMFIVLSIALLLQWRWATERGEEMTQGLSAALGAFQKQLKIESNENQAILRAIRQGQTDLRSDVVAGIQRRHTEAEFFPGESSEEPGWAEDEVSEIEDSGVASQEGEVAEVLPALPPGTPEPTTLLKKFKLVDFLKDERFNPNQRELSFIERVRAGVEASRASANVRLIEIETKLAIGESMEELRNSGEYVDYVPGEAYHRVPDVLTCAEKLADGTTRMYYLYPDAYPEIYRLKKERQRVAQEAVQKLVAMVSG